MEIKFIEQMGWKFLRLPFRPVTLLWKKDRWLWERCSFSWFFNWLPDSLTPWAPSVVVSAWQKPKGLSCTLCRKERLRCRNVCLPSSSLLNVPTHHIADHLTKFQAPLYHPWPLHLLVRECALLHHMSSLRQLVHWWDWESAAGTLQWTPA